MIVSSLIKFSASPIRTAHRHCSSALFAWLFYVHLGLQTGGNVNSKDQITLISNSRILRTYVRSEIRSRKNYDGVSWGVVVAKFLPGIDNFDVE